MKYDFKPAAELGWIVVVAVAAQAAQMLDQSSIEDVLNNPESWGIAFAAALGRVAVAAFRANVGRLVSTFFGGTN